MTKIMDNLARAWRHRLHGAMALIYRSLCADACTRLYKEPGHATGTEAVGPLCDDTGLGKQLSNDKPV